MYRDHHTRVYSPKGQILGFVDAGRVLHQLSNIPSQFFAFQLTDINPLVPSYHATKPSSMWLTPSTHLPKPTLPCTNYSIAWPAFLMAQKSKLGLEMW